MNIRIPIFTDDAGWHGNQLAQAFAVRGCEAVFVSLQDCLIEIAGNVSSSESPIQIPHFNALPKAIFVRGIAGGTLQQITTRLNILHMLKALGVFVYNDGKAIERTVDKAMTSFLLHQAVIATPRSWVCESRNSAHKVIADEVVLLQNKLVVKPLFGSQGQGVRMIEAQQPPLPRDTFVDGVFYLQQFIDSPHDYRVFVLNNQVIAAMRRTGEGWLHNVAQGAQCESINDADVLAIALQAAAALDIGYCGVDVIRDKSGKLWVLEVNSIPAWRGLQAVSKVNIAQALVDDFLNKIE